MLGYIELAVIDAIIVSHVSHIPVIFDVGLPTAGKVSMTEVFGTLGYRAANESFGGKSNKFVIKYLHFEQQNDVEVSEWLQRRTSKELVPETFSTILPVAAKVFPGSIYFYQMQCPLQWAESLYDWLPNSRGNFPDIMTKLVFQSEDSDVAPKIKKTNDTDTFYSTTNLNIPVWSFQTLAKYYAEQTKAILKQVPSGRLFVSETLTLSAGSTIRSIAQFLDLNSLRLPSKYEDEITHVPHAIIPERPCGSRNENGAFRFLPLDYIEQVIEEQICTELEGLFDQHVTTFGSRPAWCKASIKRSRTRAFEGYDQLDKLSTRRRLQVNCGICGVAGGSNANGGCGYIADSKSDCTDYCISGGNSGYHYCAPNVFFGTSNHCCYCYSCTNSIPTSKPTQNPTRAPTFNSTSANVPSGLTSGSVSGIAISVGLIVVALVCGVITFRRRTSDANPDKTPDAKIVRGAGSSSVAAYIEMLDIASTPPRANRSQELETSSIAGILASEQEPAFCDKKQPFWPHLESKLSACSGAVASSSVEILSTNDPSSSLLKLVFDKETGFPCNADTQRRVSLLWQGRSTLSRVEHDVYRSFRVPYALLESTTGCFSEAYCIGGGASCAVYKAMVYNTWVAVKALNLRSNEASKKTKSEARQFAAEMGFLMTIQHSNICRLLGVSTDGGRRCLVLEFCSGGALDKRLKRDSSLLDSGHAAILSWEQRLQIAVGIARALSYLHSLKPAMIHRDVKSQNVLLLHDNCTDWVANTKLADFGTVREDKREKNNSEVATDVTGNQKSHGITKHIIGTRPYMPGEYTIGRVGPKTDSFAFGIVLIELLLSINGARARSLLEFSERPLIQELISHPNSLRIGWPKSILVELAKVAYRCTYHYASRRSTVCSEIRTLEAMLIQVTYAPQK
jgi:hypothetical protein